MYDGIKKAPLGPTQSNTAPSKINTLYNKRERNDGNNYREISLLSIVGKVFARVILIRLRVIRTKTAYMPCNDYDNNSRNYEEIQPGDNKLNIVTTFEYLGSIFDTNGGGNGSS